MSSHAYHGPSEQHLILKDECPRCAEHAADPWRAIDRDRLDRLIAMALRRAYGDDRCDRAHIPEERPPGSATEEEACGRILEAIRAAAALFGAEDGPEWPSEVRREQWQRETPW